MATTEAFDFAPTAGDLVLQAFARIGIRRAALLAEHLSDARAELNLLQSSWANRGPNLWTIDQVSIPLTAGVATYPVSPSTIQILDAWISEGGIDTTVTSIGHTDYAGIPDKTQAGSPTQFWLARTVSPAISLYPVPDRAGLTLKFFRYRVQQDAELRDGFQVEVPQRWNDAIVADLAHRLARIYKNDLEDRRKMDAMEAFNFASAHDVENTPIDLAPDISSYFP